MDFNFENITQAKVKKKVRRNSKKSEILFSITMAVERARSLDSLDNISEMELEFPVVEFPPLRRVQSGMRSVQVDAPHENIISLANSSQAPQPSTQHDRSPRASRTPPGSTTAPHHARLPLSNLAIEQNVRHAVRRVVSQNPPQVPAQALENAPNQQARPFRDQEHNRRRHQRAGRGRIQRYQTGQRNVINFIYALANCTGQRSRQRKHNSNRGRDGDANRGQGRNRGGHYR